jgi:hypothetical protein
MAELKIVHPLKWCNHCDRSTQCRDDSPVCFWCKQPWGSGEKKKDSAEIEQNVLTAALHWHEARQCNLMSDNLTTMLAKSEAENALANAVSELIMESGGF